ncbi:papilin-like isoform X2 [Sphaerodactylus townsendi]|uniref:papilin-like isoform X2 n=1 Tax=Sphaerodactylus townsendi TaxID=933632 RepID=UPI0020263C7C|nr:papilin-like isoform X2 [Sphaerodactylus townsendi]
MEVRRFLLLGAFSALQAAHTDPGTDICTLPAEKGPCDGYFPVFYYSSSSHTCKGFIYGGCGGNENRFPTLEMCLWSCMYKDICRLPVKQGRCKHHKVRYFYNHTNKTCEKFTYGGCRGNKNRFQTLDKCHTKCLYPEVCKLPADPGPCEAHMPRYYYDPHNKSCELFVYGGCQGNRNRFFTLQQYICVLPADTGPCFNYTRMYHYSPASKECLPFPYGGCQGNANRFPTLEECIETCSRKDICKLPQDPGPCSGHIPRFYYNSLNKTCEQFVYGGCEGNDNRFETQTECAWKCRNPDICKLPPETGPCRAARLRYYYNPRTQKCEIFTYGGCKGNENQFETLEECEHACKKPSLCRLPLNARQENASIAMYYYNPAKQACEKSLYGVHKGNPNRFATRVECWETCRDPDICKLPKDPGACEERVLRFYYDATTRLCTAFNYTGCKGNKNNFATKEECRQTCQGPEKPGSCPRGFPGSCQVTCQKDCDCPGAKKCCFTGCGQVCLEPVKAKPGSCPPVPAAATNSCSKGCQEDSDCPGAEKCCSNGGGRTCQPPRP